MGGELTEGVGEQKPTLHDQNTTSNPALKTTSTQAFQEISSPFVLFFACRGESRGFSVLHSLAEGNLGDFLSVLFRGIWGIFGTYPGDFC